MSRKLNIAFAVLSISALAIFLTFWLKKSYEEEKDSLRKELQIQFSKASQKATENIIDNIFAFFVDTIQVQNRDNYITKESRFNGLSRGARAVIGGKSRDSFSIVQDTILFMKQVMGKNKFIASDSLKSKVNTSVTVKYEDATDRPVSFVVNRDNDSLDITSVFITPDSDITGLSESLRDTLREVGLPFNFRLSSMHSVPSDDSLRIVLKSKNPLKRRIIVATFDNFFGYIIGNLYPHIFISILLLALVGAAFYFAYKSLSDQERIGRIKNDFISNMTHELKTPISTVSVAIEAMQNFDALEDRSKTTEYLGIAKGELNRLTILVDKVLKMSQFDSHGAPIEKMSETSLREIIEGVGESMALQIEKYDAAFVMQLSDEDCTVLGDRVHLSNIVYNLIDNALKYGGDKPSVMVRLKSDLDSIILSVKDKGVGIAKEYQDKVFDKFFRIPKGNIHDVKGYGLGLSYVAGVVKAHGGNIILESEINVGTEFIIELPKYA